MQVKGTFIQRAIPEVFQFNSGFSFSFIPKNGDHFPKNRTEWTAGAPVDNVKTSAQ
jgi:hypothetical protein